MWISGRPPRTELPVRAIARRLRMATSPLYPGDGATESGVDRNGCSNAASTSHMRFVGSL